MNQRKGLTFLGQHSGHSFYTFAAFDNMCMARKDAFLIRHEEFQTFGMSSASHDSFLDLIIEFGNKGEVMEIAQLAGHVKYLKALPVNKHKIAYITAPLVLIDNEDVNQLEQEETELKMQLSLKNEAIQSFFLTALNLLSISGQHLPDSNLILESLANKQSQMVETIFYEKVGVRTIIPHN